MAKKIAVILFPGSNCELEAVRACERAKMQTELFRWNNDYSKLEKYDAYIIPGGFSYEDRGRSGVIASKDPIMDIIKKEHSKGKPVLGICNGAQILVEKRLIPGINPENLEMALGWNQRVKKGKILGVGFHNDWFYVRSDAKTNRSVFNRFSQKIIMRIPIANGEGRFTTQDPSLLKNLIQNEQTLFRFCDQNGKITPDFPTNPNNSMYNLAGVCNPDGNILALMPHPERTMSGQPIFDSLADYLENGQKKIVQVKKTTKNAKIIKTKIENLQKKPDITILIKLLITDNEERTIENSLKRLNFKNVSLSRQVFLGFYLNQKKNLPNIAEKLIKSGEILNLNKEIPTIFIGKNIYSYTKEKGLYESKNRLPKAFNFFVTEFDDYTGKSIHANLQQHLQNNLIKKVTRGVFWSLKTRDHLKIKNMITTNIFHNPHSMKLVQI